MNRTSDPDLIARWKAHQASLQPKRTNPARRTLKRPTWLAAFEQSALAADPPEAVKLDWALFHELLRYVRNLERDETDGSFW